MTAGSDRRAGSYLCPRAVGSLLVHEGHTVLDLSEARTKVTRVFMSLCALAPAPAPSLLLSGAGLGTPGLGVWCEGQCRARRPLCNVYCIDRSPLGPRVSPPPPRPHLWGEFHRAKGNVQGPTLQQGCLGKADSPRRRSNCSPPQVLPCRPLPPQEWRFLPFPMAEKVRDLLVHLKINLVCFSPTWTHSILCSGHSSGPETWPRSQWLSQLRESSHSLICHQVPVDLGTSQS